MLIILAFCVVTTALGSQLPSGIKLCHRSDPDFQRCLAINVADGIKLFVKGNKELGVPQLEPFFIPKIEIKGSTDGSIRMDQKYENVYLYGTAANLDLTKYNKFDFDETCLWEFDAASPSIQLVADYELKGHLLVFPINGHGKCNITQYNTVNRNRATCMKYTKNNETYLKITSYSMDINVDRVRYYFENIFPGDERISAEILKTLNDNDVEIFKELKGGFEKVLSTVYMQTMNNVFSKIPLKDIIPD